MVRDTLVTRRNERWTVALAIGIACACMLFAISSTTAVAQPSDSVDFESPIIEHTEVDGGRVGGVEVFGATVVDNDEIARVVVFYRFSGETEFADLSMREIAQSSFYMARIDTANVPLDTEAIEYYIQAEDASGNIVLKGFAFQPLTRAFEPPAVVEPEVEQDAAPVEAEFTSPSLASSINWWYVGLGALLVGGIVAATDSDSSGPRAPDGDCIGNSCTVTLTFERP